MTVRDGMIEMISEVKRLTELGYNTPDDFNDEDVQKYLDRNKEVYTLVSLRGTPTRLANNAVIYRNYYLPDSLGDWFELPQTGDVSEAFYVQTSTFEVVTFGNGESEAVFDQYLKRIVFNEDTAGLMYWLSVYCYDINGAAADIWGAKLASRVGLVNIKTDNHTINMGDEYTHIMERYQYFLSRSKKNSYSKMIRTDQSGSPTDYPVRGFMPVGSY